MALGLAFRGRESWLAGICGALQRSGPSPGGVRGGLLLGSRQALAESVEFLESRPAPAESTEFLESPFHRRKVLSPGRSLQSPCPCLLQSPRKIVVSLEYPTQIGVGESLAVGGRTPLSI